MTRIRRPAPEPALTSASPAPAAAGAGLVHALPPGRALRPLVCRTLSAHSPHGRFSSTQHREPPAGDAPSRAEPLAHLGPAARWAGMRSGADRRPLSEPQAALACRRRPRPRGLPSAAPRSDSAPQRHQHEGSARAATGTGAHRDGRSRRARASADADRLFACRWAAHGAVGGAASTAVRRRSLAPARVGPGSRCLAALPPGSDARREPDRAPLRAARSARPLDRRVGENAAGGGAAYRRTRRRGVCADPGRFGGHRGRRVAGVHGGRGES